MITWINASTSGRNGTRYIAVSVIESIKRNPSTRQIVLRFSSEAQKDLRLISGDRLQIGFNDATRQICFKRTTGTGYKLTSSTSLKGEAPTAAQKNLVVQATTDRPAVKAVQYQKDDLVFESSHIAINAPEFFLPTLTKEHHDNTRTLLSGV